MEIKWKWSQEITEGVIYREKNRNTKHPQTDGYRKTRRMRRMPDILPIRLQNFLRRCKPEVWKCNEQIGFGILPPIDQLMGGYF